VAGYRRCSHCLLLAIVLISCAGSLQDKAIDRAVTHALIDYEPTNLHRIDVSADRGTVYLSGDVETNEQKEQAEQIARRVEGVRHVVNKLQVQP
jgi:hyperosmotically inducible periplasmic protein